jgi:hypothetical protein
VYVKRLKLSGSRVVRTRGRRGEFEDIDNGLVGVGWEDEAVDVQDSGAVEVDAVEVLANLVAGGRMDQYVDATDRYIGVGLTWGRICSGRPCSWEG